MKQNFGELLMFEHLFENHTRVQSDFLIFVALESGKYDIWLRRQILDGGESGTDLSTKEKREYLGDILSRLEFETGNMSNEMIEQVGVVRFLCKLGD